MRKLTADDMANIAGSTVEGYHVEGVRVKRGRFTDSDNYGIILGRNASGNYVTWQLHMLEDETVSAYWGHYFGKDREAALRDFDNRDRDASTFNVSMDNRKLLEAIENYLFTQNGETIPHPTGFEEDLLDDIAGSLMGRIDFFGKSESAYAEESDEQRDFCKDIWNVLRYAICVGAAVERGDLTLK